MADKRERKMNGVNKELRNKCVKVYGNKKSKKVIVGWGSTKGIILEALKELDYKFVQVLVPHPFPAEEFMKKIGKYNKLVVIENNMTSQLGKLIKSNTCIKISDYFLKYDGRPFNPEDIIGRLK